MKTKHNDKPGPGQPHKWALAGGTGLLVAFAAAGFYLLTSRSISLEDRIKAFRAAENGTTASASAVYADPIKTIAELEAFQADPRFARLPEEPKEYVQTRLNTFKAYLDYKEKLDRVPDPMDARTSEQLLEIKEQLSQLTVPSEHDEWRASPAGKRQAEWLSDASSLENAVTVTKTGYDRLTEAGRKVILKDQDAPGLPLRAKKVLNMAAEVPDPRKRKDETIPGSNRITYDVVLRMESVAGALAQWEEIRPKLAKLAELDH